MKKKIFMPLIKRPAKAGRWEPNMQLKYLSWIPAAIVIIMIFCFSAKTAEVSDQGSLQIATVVYQIYENISGPIAGDQQTIILSFIDHIIRKMAHCFEYSILSICISFHLWVCGRRRYKLFTLSILFSALYATTDEFHQLFVEGRAGRISDVVIDTSGAAIGAAFFLLTLYVIQRVKLHKVS